jgi:hypothetical protein
LIIAAFSYSEFNPKQKKVKNSLGCDKEKSVQIKESSWWNAEQLLSIPDYIAFIVCIFLMMSVFANAFWSAWRFRICIPKVIGRSICALDSFCVHSALFPFATHRSHGRRSPHLRLMRLQLAQAVKIAGLLFDSDTHGPST